MARLSTLNAVFVTLMDLPLRLQMSGLGKKWLVRGLNKGLAEANHLSPSSKRDACRLSPQASQERSITQMIEIPMNKDYCEQAEKCRDAVQPCIVCGKPAPTTPFTIHVHRGGGTA